MAIFNSYVKLPEGNFSSIAIDIWRGGDQLGIQATKKSQSDRNSSAFLGYLLLAAATSLLT